MAAVLCVAGLAAAWPAAAGARAVGHVFVLVLENEDASTTFGAHTDAPYLANHLRKRGAFLPNYYGTSHESLGNYISMISGQAANPATQADCPVFLDFLMLATAADGQAVGHGCVYPASVQTVADQLQAAGLGWRGYMQDMRNGGPGEPKTCRHPAVGSRDDTQKARADDQYATRHDPFVYFHSIIDDPSYCSRHVVGLARLRKDLRSARRTPSFSFITPDLCNDGHDEPCASGEPGGLVQADRFLRKWVPMIRRSPAFRRNGLLVITFDEAAGDASACCGEQAGYNTPRPGINGPGGGRVGAVVLSRCIRPGTIDRTPYNHFSLLRSVEGFFGLPYLGYAAQDGLSQFGPALLSRCATAQASARRLRQGGTNRADRIKGTRGSDVLRGRGGRDLIRGLGGKDHLYGGGGNDTLLGGRGPDVLRGGRGHDYFNNVGGVRRAGAGNDRILARDGKPDTIDCGPGRDVAIVDRKEDGVFDCEVVKEPKP
jgi:phosphatidylinositol-3-phosphatase